jgi:hypothetical protein
MGASMASCSAAIYLFSSEVARFPPACGLVNLAPHLALAASQAAEVRPAPATRRAR